MISEINPESLEFFFVKHREAFFMGKRSRCKLDPLATSGIEGRGCERVLPKALLPLFKSSDHREIGPAVVV